MLSQAQRTAILELSAKGVSKREIAQVLRLSRPTVRKVLRENSTNVPEIQRAEKAEPYREQILDLLISCKGNLVRVHEELVAGGAALSYPALTAFCRRQGIGQTPAVPAGQYHFEPGVEMQHDTSPHEVEVGGRKYKAQTASAVLCYSRMLFFQINPTFQRFDCKVFLTDALRYMGGAPERVMIDNTHVVVLRGTGREMIPVPEMEAFGERFGFRFVAHERGDANRSARVERPFSFIENNFLAGRTFASWADLNQQARQWCDRVNSTYKKHIRGVPRELFAVERMHLKPLPAWIPEVYRLHQRTVDVEGYVSVNSIRYSVPAAWIGHRVEVRETRDKIEIEMDARHIVTHARAVTPLSQRITLAAHRPPRGEGVKRSDPHPEEKAIVEAAPETALYVAALKQKSRKVVALALRQLLRLLREYPREPFLAAVQEAARYGLYDLDRLERMILRRVARDYFLLLDPDTDSHAEELEQLLKNLKLRRMLGVYDEQLRAAEKAQASYSEFVAGLLRAQWHDRQESALEWRIRRANLPERWSLESFPWSRQPGVNRKQMRAFAELDFVAQHENLVLVGPTGVGKTGLASGLLLKALENGHRCQFIRAQDLFDEMYASLADRSTRRLLNRLARLDVLLIDEFGYLNLKPEQSNTFFKLMEERYHRHSTIITTNLVYDVWHNFLGNKPMGRRTAEPRAALLPHRDHQWPFATRSPR